jgi:hypothetical protein
LAITSAVRKTPSRKIDASLGKKKKNMGRKESKKYLFILDSFLPLFFHLFFPSEARERKNGFHATLKAIFTKKSMERACSPLRWDQTFCCTTEGAP